MFLLQKFDNSSPSCAYELMTHYLLRQSTQWNLLNEVYLLSKFDDSSFSLTENIQIFKLVILQTKVDIHFADFGQVKIDPTHSFSLT